MEELKTNDYLRGIVMNLPTSPGIYQYLNAEGTIIYVGKAKNLKRRVYSYFSKDHHSAKTRILVSKIADIRYIVVNTEEDALLLENNLIKKYKPRYNVLLKDDKSYPSICVSNEYFPRVFKTRKIVRDGSTYFGPYTHFPSMQAMLELIKKLYPLRTCHLALTPENIQANKFRVCLEYHIKNCKGPCIGAQSHEEYMKNIASIKELLKGNTQKISQGMMREMMHLAEEMKFEEAQQIKEKYELIESYRSKSEVVSSVLHNIDVFAIEADEKSAYINYLHITNGCINQAFTFEYKKRLDETKEELLEMGIVEMRERYKSQSKEIIVPFELDLEMEGITFTIPQRGDKKHLLELSILNVKQYKVDRLKQAEKLNPEQRSVRRTIAHGENAPAHRMLRQLEHPRRGCRSGLRGIQKRTPQQTRLPQIQHQDGSRSGRLRFNARSRAPPLFAHLGGTRRTARLDIDRWRKGTNGSGARSHRRRTAPAHSHCRTCQRQPPPYFGNPFRIPAYKHRAKARHSPLPFIGKHTRRSAPLCHHLPPRKAKQTASSIGIG